MGRIDNRLTKVLQIVKPGTPIPIIVETLRSPSSSDIQELNNIMIVKRTSTIVNQVYGVVKEELIGNIANLAFVSVVYYDEPVNRFQSSVIPSISISKEDIVIPISDSAQFIGATDLHDIGIKGKGIKVAVIDTGCNKNHPLLEGAIKTQINIAKKNGAENADDQDGNGHGCFKGNSEVFTENFGLSSLENIWNKTNSEIIQDEKGEYKLLYDRTISRNGITNVKAIYRTKADKQVIISTPHKTIICTTWHRMFVCRPFKDRNGKKRWYEGVDINTVEAKFLNKFESVNLNGDSLLNSSYFGYTWTVDLANAEISYLYGLYSGDGCIYDNRKYYEIRITDNSREFLEKVAGIYGGTIREASSSEAFELSIYGRNISRDINNMSLDNIFRDIEMLRAWLAGFFDAEGYVNEIENKVNICNTDLELLKRVSSILNIIGVPCNVVSGGTSGITGLSPGCISYHLNFYIPKTLYDFIGDYCIKKKEELIKIINKKGHGKVLKLHDNILFTPVNGVKLSDCNKEDYFYDLSTEDGNYCVDGFIVHNSWVATCVGGRDKVIYSKKFNKNIRMHGVAPECEIIAIKVLDDDGSGQTSWVIEGMEAAVEAGADIINMSLGSIFDGGGISPDSKVVDEITFKHNILCAVAAGNSFTNFSIGSPGGSRGALTVGSIAMQLPYPNTVSTFSSKGLTTDGRVKPDISAPGGNLLNIKEAIYAGTSGGMAKESGEEYIGIMGTSMATPHVAGCLALLLQAGMKRDRYFVEDLIGNTATMQHPKDANTGWGTINVKKAYNYLIENKSIAPISSLSKLIDTALMPFSALIPQSEQTSAELEVRLPYIR